MSMWKFNGGILNFEELPIENLKEGPSRDKANKNNYNDDEDEGAFLKITFLAIINILDEFTITAGDDGYLYIWRNYKLAGKKVAHQRIAILCLSVCQQNPIIGSTQFVSGGVNGTVILWEMGYLPSSGEYRLIPLFEYPIYQKETIKDVIKNPKYHIQSLQYRFNLIIAGTRSGDIYFLAVIDPDSDPAERADMNDVIKRVYTCHDNEIPKECDFSSNVDRIFCITEKGLFSSWDFERLEQLVSIPFKKNTVAMIVFKQSELVVIAFEFEVLVLDVEDPTNVDRIKSYSLEFLVPISDVKVSANEKILAVALAPYNESPAKIEIYLTDNENKKFTSKHTIDNISSK